MRRAILVVAVLLIAATHAAWCQTAPGPLFYAPFDGMETALSIQGRLSSSAVASDVLFLDLAGQRFSDGIIGQGFRAESSVSYPSDGAFLPQRGTLSLWFRPDFDGTDTNLYSTLFGVQNWGLLYKYTDQTIITFGVIKEDGNYDYGCTASIAHWKKGEWHHVAITWDREARRRVIYLDGKLAHEGVIPSYREADTKLHVGANWSGQNPARGTIDEVWILDRPLTEEEIAAAYEATKGGKPAWKPPAGGNLVQGESQLPSGNAAELPPGVDWSFYEPAIERTESRVRIPLSGYWRFAAAYSADEPVDRAKMGFLRVPGTWASTDQDWAVVRGPDMERITKLPDDRPIKWAMYGWYEREFTVPEEFAGKRVLLTFDSVRALAEVWVNGKHAGRALEFEETVFDITGVARIGQTNTVDVLVQALSRDGDAKGIDQDVWLEAVPDGPRLRAVGFMPSVSDGVLGIRAELASPAGGQIRLAVDCTGQDGSKKSAIATLRAEADAGNQQYPTAAGSVTWADAHTWSPDDPHLYTAKVRLLGPDDEALDALYPFRFGFREFEIRGGDLYLNGVKTHLRGNSSPPFSSAQFNSNELATREWITNFKEAGGNVCRDYSYGMQTCSRFWGKQTVFDLADETGVMFFAHMPDLRNVLPGWQYESVREGYRKRIASYMRTYRNHPCIIMWQQDFNLAAHTGDIAPFMLGQDYFPDYGYFPERKRVATEGEQMVRQIDPSLPVLHHASGDMGQMRTTMTYLGFGIPLQEREEWPKLWAARKSKPLMIMETGFPCILSYYKTRGNRPLYDVYHSEPLVAEYTAMTLGERAYELEGEEQLAHYNPERYGAFTEEIRECPAYQAQKEIWATNSLRSWRTWDMSGIVLHVEIREGYHEETVDVPAREFDPRTPHMYVEKLPITMRKAVKTLPMYDALRRANQPVIGYIGGPQPNWVSKDHSYFEGETVGKSAIFINDRTVPVTIKGRWRADFPGWPMAAEAINVTVQPGETLTLPILFSVPKGISIPYGDAAGEISLEAEASDGTSIRDTFPFEMYPRRRPPVIARCVLIPGDGSTRKMLQDMEVGFSEWDGQGEVPETDLLIIGRRAGVWTREIEERVATGKMHVVCFEQEGPEFAGLRLDDAWARDCFVATRIHQVLFRLDDVDFRYWRGDSDITEAYPNPGLGDAPSYPEEFWHWGNTNCVSTYAIEKPQRPGFTPLLSCEFDLLYTPLLEWRLGLGNVLFCQLDVSNRYGTDPVATTLVNQILDLYGKPGRLPTPVGLPAPTPVSRVAIVGANAEKLKQVLGIEAETFGEAPDEDELSNVLRDRGVVVLLADIDPHEQYDWTPPLKQARIAKTDLDHRSRCTFHGVSNSDVFWKRYQDLTVLDGLPDSGRMPPTGIFATFPRGYGKVIVMRYDPFSFEDPRQRTKSLRVLSLLMNTCNIAGPTSILGGEAYAEATLDFNPHSYRRW